jgi:hypothetical protein
MVEGTHLGLQETPSLHGEDYLTQKSEYAIVAMVVCNGKRRICYLNVGWPASMYDQGVWKNSYINHNLQWLNIWLLIRLFLTLILLFLLIRGFLVKTATIFMLVSTLYLLLYVCIVNSPMAYVRAPVPG